VGAKTKKTDEDEGEPPEAREVQFNADASLVFQGLIGLGVWMSFGLLLEGLIAFRIPYYLSDAVTREMFRLAHAHGTLLSLILVTVGLTVKAGYVSPAAIVTWMLRTGSILMPVGFLLGGIGNTANDPSPLVFLAPMGGIMIIFGIVTCVISFKRK
jgi:hypothetical protein